MSHRLLSADGSIRQVAADEIASTIAVDASDPDFALQDIMQASADSIVLIELSGSADGRGFSVIGHLAASRKTDGPATWIGGHIIPDHVTLALQCGASAVLVSDELWQARGETAWTNALNPAVKIAYRSQVWSTVTDISQSRF